MRDNELKAKIKAVNRANAYANELKPKLLAVFAPLVGQNLFRADGNLLAKVQKLLPELPCGPFLHVYRSTFGYSLAWTVKTCEMIEGTSACVYHETTTYVGNLANGVLTTLDRSDPRPTDYDFDEVQRRRQKAKRLKGQYEEARNDCYPFPEE